MARSQGATSSVSALYYPFSRCINAASLKHMLLLFDRIAFLDPVADEDWRADLLGSLVPKHPRFAAHAEVAAELHGLLQDGVVYRIDPSGDPAVHAPATAASAVSDLFDPAWTELASRAAQHDLPVHRTMTGLAGWEIFPAKLPAPMIDLLREEPLRHHLIREDDNDHAWMLSYAAGSAATINAHFAVADAQGLAPITDSALHHRLMLLKLARAGAHPALGVSDEVAKLMANQVGLRVIEEVMPPDRIAALSVAQILRFREDTQAARASMHRELDQRMRALLGGGLQQGSIERAVLEVTADLRKYNAELRAAARKAAPGLMRATALPGSAALTAFLIGSPAHVVAGAALIGVLGSVASLLDVRSDRGKTVEAAAPVVSYLSHVKQLVSSSQTG